MRMPPFRRCECYAMGADMEWYEEDDERNRSELRNAARVLEKSGLHKQAVWSKKAFKKKNLEKKKEKKGKRKEGKKVRF